MADDHGTHTFLNDAPLPTRCSASCVGRCACTECRAVCVYCVREPPCEIHDHRHSEAQILIAPESAEWEASWQDRCGRRVQRRIRGGAVWVLPPGTGHSVRWLRESTLIVLQVDPGWADRVALGVVGNARMESLGVCTAIDPLIAVLTSELHRIGDQASQSLVMQMVALGHCLAARLLQVLARDMATSPPAIRRQLGPERLARVVEFIERHCGERITQAMLAREACLSAGHFGVLFKATTGMTPEQYVLRTRLLRAKSLIESGKHTVSEVAYMTGFADHSHFTFQFKRFHGYPPRTFLPSLRRV